MRMAKQLLCGWSLSLFFSCHLLGEDVKLTSRTDPSLDYPVRVVEAQPYLKQSDDASPIASKENTGQTGNFKVVHRSLGTVPAERLRLPVPGSTWRLDGRVGRTSNGTIHAGFGVYLYSSSDEGRTWVGQVLEGLPHTQGERVNVHAFGVSGKYIYIAHWASTLPPVVPDEVDDAGAASGKRRIHPMVISRSKDGGHTWDASGRLTAPPPYKVLAGDGNSIVALGNGTLLTAIDSWDPDAPHDKTGRDAQVLFRSTDGGLTWGDPTLIPDTAAETGLLPLGGLRVLAAIRGIPSSRLAGKTVELANSDDGGRTWTNPRPLTRTFGQAHCELAPLPGGGVVAVYDNRYPYLEGDVRARISWNGGETWEPELYILAKGHGYAGSVAGTDGTIITVMGDAQLGSDGKPTGRGYTLQALRWKPWAK